MNEIENDFSETFSPNLNFDTKTVFRKIKLIFGLKNLLGKLKKSNFQQVRHTLSYKT